jgi:septum site-determining protein MinC
METATEALPALPRGPAFEVKGTIAPVTVLCLRTVDVGRIERELAARIAPAPQMFLNAPCVIDLADVIDAGGPLPLDAIVRLVRACRLNPVGLAHLPAGEIQRAADVGLAVVQLGFGRSKMARRNATSPEAAATLAPLSSPVAELVAAARAAAEPPPLPPPPVVESDAPAAAAEAAAVEPVAAEPTAAEPTAAAPAPKEAEKPPLTLTVRQPVRGGQVVYGKADVVVVAPVNPGAQIIADGHVHVYGRLRGRALAGAHGNTDARVFCQSLEAELISVAGEFLTADAIPPNLRGKPAQIFVEHGEVRVAPL